MNLDNVVFIEGEGWVYWPRCEIPACPNRICLSKGETRFCWPHSSSGKTVHELISEGQRELTAYEEAKK